ncbi:MAG: hypothetical protein QUS14_12735 [Pyrinomonadaceae bacterium]|nr:hypothetical protein [Pyrinomonadaceae bacterium]
MTPKEHNRTLGILFLVYLGLQIIGLAIGVVSVFIMIGAISASDPNAAPMMGIMSAVMIFAFVFGGLLMIPIAGAGFKLLKEKPGARTWGIVAAIIALINIPLGTILGVYGLWFLFSEPGKAFYLGQDQPTMMPPPPPNSWQ